MTPELIAAVRERLALGHELDAIRAELRTAGYDEQTIEATLRSVQSGESAQVAPVPQATNASTPAVLPSVTELLEKGISFVLSRWDLVALLTVPFLIVMIAPAMSWVSSALFPELTSETLFVVGIPLLLIVSAIIHVLTLAAALHVVHHSAERKVSIGEALTWARRHVLGLFWIIVLSMLVVWGGFILLIIPAIIVSIYVVLAHYVYTAEGVRGIGALLRSRALVMGNWWPIAVRLLLVSFVLMVAQIIMTSLTFLLSMVAGSSGEWASLVLSHVLSALMILIGLKVGFILYSALAAHRPLTATQTSDAKGRYVTLAVVGLLLPVSWVVLLASLNDARDTARQASFEQQLSTLRTYAELYAFDQDFSYEGFCSTVDDFPLGTVRDCVDSKEGWAAVAVSTVDGEQYCVNQKYAPAPGRLSVTEASCEFDADPKQRAGELRMLGD